MGILLVRHADAVEGGGEIDDSARWLSPAGRDRARTVAALVGRELATRGLTFAHFLASPRVRAVQTAELFAGSLGFAGPIEIVPALSFTVPAQRAQQALKRFSGSTIAVFGHMPTLGDLCMLLAERADPSFAPAEAVLVEQGQVSFRLSAPS